MATREEVEAAAEALLRWMPGLFSQASKLAGEVLDAAERVRRAPRQPFSPATFDALIREDRPE